MNSDELWNLLSFVTLRITVMMNSVATYLMATIFSSGHMKYPTDAPISPMGVKLFGRAATNAIPSGEMCPRASLKDKRKEITSVSAYQRTVFNVILFFNIFNHRVKV